MTRPAPARLATLLGLVLACAAPAGEPPHSDAAAPPRRRDQELQPDGARLVDHGWGFELGRPGADWRLMEEAEARRVRFGAVAGLVHDGSRSALLVLPRPAGARAVEAVVAARQATLELTDLQTTPPEKRPLAGQEAVAWEARGRRGQHRLEVAGAVLIERGRRLELLWVTPAGSALQAPWEALRLTGAPGPLAGRPPVGRATPDLEGIGWRVADGVAESGTLGVRVDPRGTGLRLLVGSGARRAVSDAELVLGDDDRQVVVGLVPLGGPPGDVAAVWTGARWGYGRPQGPPPKPLPPVPVTKGQLELALGSGQQVSLRWDRHEDPSHPWEAGEGVLVVDGAPRLLVRARARVRPDSQRREVLAAALDCLSALAAAEREELAAALLARPDPQGQVGKDWWYRGDALRHAELDLTFARPAGWRMVLDEEVLAAPGQATLLVAEAPRLGIVAWAEAWRPREDDPAAFHAAALQELASGQGAEPAGEPHAGRGGVSFRCSWPEGSPLPGVPRARTLIATAVQAGRALRVVVTGPSEALEAARGAALALLDGFKLEGFDLEDEAENESAWRSKRLGVIFRTPGEGWRLLASAAHGSRTRQLEARDDDGRRLLLLIAGAAADAPDPAEAEELLRQALLRELEQGDEEALDLAAARPLEEQLGGAPCRRFQIALGAGPAELLFCHPPGRHVLLVSLAPEEGAPLPWEEVKRSLQLLP